MEDNQIKLIALECLLMPNKEILFKGKSLGFLSDDEIKKYIKEIQ